MKYAQPGRVLKQADINDRMAAAKPFRHPWNPNSQVHGVRLSQEAGLERTGISFARIEPGKESFVYHSHEREEEWIYILTGRAVARIDGEEHPLGPGDFVGFPTPSVAHHLSNPFDEPLEYLMGGECRELEIAEFPELNKRMIRRQDRIDIYPLDGAEPFPSQDE